MRRLVIFCMGRSGSTLLVSLLNAHHAIYCDGEVFPSIPLHQLRSVVQRFPFPYLAHRQFIARYLRGSSTYGFKLLLSQTRNPDAMVHLLHSRGWHVIYLERLAVFAQAISGIVADRTRRFHSSIDQAEPIFSPFPIDPEMLLSRVLNRERNIRRCRDIVSELPHLTITYENDLASPNHWNATVGRVCAYVGIDPATESLTTNLQKPWSRPYSELITNYAELVELARQNGYDV